MLTKILENPQTHEGFDKFTQYHLEAKRKLELEIIHENKEHIVTNEILRMTSDTRDE